MNPLHQRIGVLGNGQLGRMMAMAGYPLGKTFGFYGPQGHSPAAFLGANFADGADDELDKLIATSDIITFETENTHVEWVKKIHEQKPVYPGIDALYTAQHRGREKAMFNELGIPCATHVLVDSLAELKQAVEQIGLPAILKTTTEGYDGKGQFRIENNTQIHQAWQAIGQRQAVLEGLVKFERELSLIAVRNPQGQEVFYPLVENIHHQGILRLTLAPAQNIDEHIQATAEGYMAKLLAKLNYVGVLTLELFQTTEGLVANEMAPRVHNSGHWTIEGAQTSQFENHIRAISGLPLGSCQIRQSHCAMINIIGETGPVQTVLRMPKAHLHLYDKAERQGRKLGHITLVADSAAELQSQLQQLQAFLPQAS